MKTDNGLAVAFFAVVIGGAVALAIANDIAAPICKAAAEAVPKDKFDFGCIEFWLNRYQTTLQTIISSAIGGAGLFFILKQLRELNAQSATARIQAAAATLDSLAKRLVELDRIKTLLTAAEISAERLSDALARLHGGRMPLQDQYNLLESADLAPVEQFRKEAVQLTFEFGENWFGGCLHFAMMRALPLITSKRNILRLIEWQIEQRPRRLAAGDQVLTDDLRDAIEASSGDCAEFIRNIHVAGVQIESAKASARMHSAAQRQILVGS